MFKLTDDINKVVIILSGGMDSTTLLYFLKSKKIEVVALSFNYGSKHNDREFECAKKTCQELGVILRRIDITFLNDLLKSDLLKSGGDIPEGHYEDKSMKNTVVPYRNGIMLSIATGYAESIGADAVAIGNHAGDHAIYPDCRPEFIENFSLAMKTGTYNNVSILSPFCEIDKGDVVQFGALLDVDWKNTYTCYNGREKHCGKCGSCTERKEAFRKFMIQDKVEYEA